MINQEKRKVLGRGLSSLIPAARTMDPQAVPQAAAPVVVMSPLVTEAQNGVREVSLGAIEANPYQTRTKVDETALAELADSIRVSGVLQPIVLRSISDGRYQLVAGQRRWMASQRAGLETIPATVRQLSDQQAMEITIVENLQREDIEPLDQAFAFQKLSEKCGLTQEQIAQRTGKERATVANYMRLLRLPSEIQSAMRAGDLTMGHAKALMGLESAEEQTACAETVVERSMSVRQTEQMVYNLLHPQVKEPKAVVVDPNVREAQRELERSLGVRVKILDHKGKGKVVIEYKSLEDFDRIIEALSNN